MVKQIKPWHLHVNLICRKINLELTVDCQGHKVTQYSRNTNHDHYHAYACEITDKSACEITDKSAAVSI